MRVGFNPNKDKPIAKTEYIHQVIIPVFIPNHDGYFKDSLKVFKRCVTSLLHTIHDKTFITIVNNGSSKEVIQYLNELYETNKIHEVIHTENIGKLNAILKGLVGNKIELVTISDADVFFLPNWQAETIKIFSEVPKAGMVGIVPQFKMYEAYCGNVIFDNFFNKNLKFLAVKNPEALKKFYDSIGWDRTYNQDYLKYNLGLKINDDLNVLIGSGHFVATYKKDVFKDVVSYIEFKMGGISEKYLDKIPLTKGYWRLTTQDNFALHLGNTYENWMEDISISDEVFKNPESNFHEANKVSPLSYFLKNRLFVKFISIPFLNKSFLKLKGLPKQMIKKY
ncbi:glycosyltransferase family A protein [Algibacter sp. 2305UL17-15]|uniref:glycosyltransferase family A protein n=1 Tax=Algibacter sp. 2305UL17-15 TaxID=3231268 RepID=UPI00345B4B77